MGHPHPDPHPHTPQTHPHPDLATKKDLDAIKKTLDDTNKRLDEHLTDHPCPAPCPGELVLSGDLLFDFDQATIREESDSTLKDFARRLAEYPDSKIVVDGHTDSWGSAEYNKDLSKRRAQAVVRYLEEQGIAPNRMTARGMGERFPIEPNELHGRDNPDGRAKNRRVELLNRGTSPD